MPNSYYDQLQGGYVRQTSAEKFLVDEARQDPSTMDVLGAAYDEVFVWNAAGRAYERRSSQFQRDNSWTLTEDAQAQLLKEYRGADVDYLKASRSEEEFLARKNYIKEDNERLRTLAQAGGGGVVAQLGLAVADPVGLALGLATGGIGWIQKGAKAQRVLKNAGVVGLESAAIEAALMQGNTQSEASDLLFAFGAGAVIGGGISAVTRGRAQESNVTDDLSSDADLHAVGRVLSDENASLQEVNVTTTGTQEVPDTGRMYHNAYKYELGLQEKAQTRLSRQEAKTLKQEANTLSAREKELEQRLRDSEAEVQPSREAVSKVESEEAEVLSSRRAEVDAEYAGRIAKAEKRVDELAERVRNAKDPRKANARLYNAQNELSDLISARDTALAKVADESRARVQTVREGLELDMARIRTSTQLELDSVRAHIGELKDAADRSKQAREASQELRRFRQMDKQQQVEYVHSKDGGGVEVPTRTETFRRNVEATESALARGSEGAEAPPIGTVRTAEATDSAGAARVGFTENRLGDVYGRPEERHRELANQYLQAGADIPDTKRGWMPFGKGFAKYMQGLYTYLSNSRSYLIRGLNEALFESPQGGPAKSVTASVASAVFQRDIRAAQRGRWMEGLEDYARESGRNPYKAAMDEAFIAEYNKKVMLETKYPGTYDSEAIKHGAAGVRDQFYRAGKIRKEGGEEGFENVDLDRNYATSVVDNGELFNAVATHGRAKVKEVLSRAYQRGKVKLDKETADEIADAYIDRALKSKVSVADSYKKNTGKDIDELVKKLERAKVPKEAIDDFIASTSESEAVKHMSDRAKFSLEPDLRVHVNGLSAVDLFDTNLPKLLEAYTADAAGGAALGRMGFRTKQEFLDFTEVVHQQAISAGVPLKEAREQVNMLRDGVEMIYGRTVNPHARTGWSRAISRMLDMTAFLRLQSLGLASIPEGARGITKNGVINFMREIPAASAIIHGARRHREGGRHSGQIKDPELRELDEIFGYPGDDHILHPQTLRSSEVEEHGYGKGFGAKIDSLLAMGKRVQSITSFYRMFQGGGERITSRAVGRNIRNWILDKEPLRAKGSRLDDAGWQEGFLDKVKAWAKEPGNTKVEEYEGKQVTTLNWDNMDPDMLMQYKAGVHRLVRRDMQGQFVGESSVFLNKLLGRVLSQFRSFSITSLEKQLIHDLRHDQVAGSLILMWSAGLGAMTHAISGALSGQEGWDDPHNMMFGTFNRMGQLASLGIAADGLATFNLIPDELMAAPNRYGFRSAGYNSVPLLGMGTDVLDTAKKTIDWGLNSDTNFGADDIVNQYQKVIPFARMKGIDRAMNHLKSELE